MARTVCGDGRMRTIGELVIELRIRQKLVLVRWLPNRRITQP
jgi:hypothetical protein